MTSAIDCFAGAGGWAVACRKLGIYDEPLELDEAALAANLLGSGVHPTSKSWVIPEDIRAFDARHVPHIEGLIASPPCQTFSTAGNKKGRNALDAVAEACWGLTNNDALNYGQFSDERTGLVLEPLRLIRDRLTSGNAFRWVALEQVPSVLPVWNMYTVWLSGYGYSTWTGCLNAEQYGVPQTRRRAVLIASLDHEVKMPTPTHSRFYPRRPLKQDPYVLPWVSMAEAMQAVIDEDWAPEFFSQSGTPVDERWPWKRPSTTVAGRPLVQNPGATANRFNAAKGVTKSRNDGIRLTIAEGAVLQTFPAGYPFQGTQSQQWTQLGNAIPPLLAEAILKAVI